MKVASFNVQRFGREKLSNKSVRETLIKIVSHYDIIVILEVVDSSGESVDLFFKELNKFYKTVNYSKIISPRQGRGKYKEQFMFLYRNKKVELVESYPYKERPPGNIFARAPYVVRFRCQTTVLKDLVLIPVHTKPEDAVKELDKLYDVFQGVKKKWETDNIMILGDFNADGTFMDKKDKEKIRICTRNFHWLIKDGVDTTASNNNEHTYDQIVVYGDNMLNAVVQNSAKSFNFQKAYKLTDEEDLTGITSQAKKVSDHYPVEVKLKKKKKLKHKS